MPEGGKTKTKFPFPAQSQRLTALTLAAQDILPETAQQTLAFHNSSFYNEAIMEPLSDGAEPEESSTLRLQIKSGFAEIDPDASEFSLTVPESLQTSLRPCLKVYLEGAW